MKLFVGAKRMNNNTDATKAAKKTRIKDNLLGTDRFPMNNHRNDDMLVCFRGFGVLGNYNENSG